MTLAGAIIAYLRAFFVPRHKLVLEAVALRQQLAVVKRKQPRPKLDPHDRWFWIVLRRLWDRWSEASIIVQPETVVSWHRAGFRLFWRLGLSDVDRAAIGDGADPPLNSTHEGGRRKIPLGARPASTANCSSSAARSPSPPFPVIWRN